MELSRFCFGHQACFLIPIEHLGPTGMSPTYAAALGAERGMGEGWIELFNRAFAQYFARAAELFARAPKSWFPPRCQSLFVITDPDRARPYSSYFPQASWQLYAPDFEPATSSLELATYLFFHAERMGLRQGVVDAFIHNLGYWLVRSADERADFRAGAARAVGPDAEAHRRLGALLEDVDRLFHDDLKPRPADFAEPCGRVSDAGLVIPLSMRAPLQQLADVAKQAANDAAARYYAAQRRRTGGDPAAELAEWVAEARPRVLVLAGAKTLWDPEEPDGGRALAAHLGDAGSEPLASLRRELAVIDLHSRRFLASVRHPERLPRGDAFEQAGGTFIHERRQLICFDLAHPNLDRTREGSYPYQRWLIGARTIHEWGHLAAEAGWVGVADARAYDAAFADVSLLLGRLTRDAPPALREQAHKELAGLGAADRDPGEAWAEWILTRMPDYLTNLLAREYLSDEEMEAYARVNVYSHAQDEPGIYRQLVRYAYELTYLGFTRVDDPVRYLADSTWFRELYVASGAITLERMEALHRAVLRLCRAHTIDREALSPPGSLSSPP